MTVLQYRVLLQTATRGESTAGCSTGDFRDTAFLFYKLSVASAVEMGCF